MISQETKARIAQEAAAHYRTATAQTNSYIAGAEREAELAQGLYDCLKLIREMPEGVWFAKTIDKALTKYNNSK